MRKKGFLTWIVVMLVVCLALPAYAAGMSSNAPKESVTEAAVSSSIGDPAKDVKITQDKALEIVKGFFEVPEDFKPEVYLNTGWQPGNRRVWTINFYKPFFSIYAIVDADSGEIISYNMNEDWSTPYGKRRVFLARYTQEEARVFAENFIKKIAPDKFSRVNFMEQNYYTGPKFGGLFEPTSYFFRFVRSDENIQPVDSYYGEEGINVTVNAASGKVVSYNLNWSEDKPSNEKTISKKQAEEIYTKYLGPQLVYVRGFDEAKGKIEDFARLMYVPQRFGYTGPPLTIRAADGALINYAGDEVKGIEPLTEIDFSGAKTINAVKLKTPLTEEQALKLAEEEIKKFGFSDMILQSFNNGPYPTKTQDLFFFNFNSTGGEGANASVTVNAVTGSVQNFGFWKNTGSYYPETLKESSSPEILGWEDAKNIALQYIKKYLPDKADNVYFMDYPQEINPKSEAPYQPYYFNFTRSVNGIPYIGNNISIGVDSKGNIISLNYAWDDITFPAPEKNILSREKAAKIMLDEMGITLAYIMPKMYAYYGPVAPAPPQKPEKILVYTLKRLYDAAYIDPITGDVLNYAFKQPGIKNPVSPLVNIKGETGRREAELLMYQGIFEPSMNIDLESVPSIKEAVKFFASCLGLGPQMYVYGPNVDEKKDPYKKYIEAALEQKLITGSEAKNLDRPLDRQELAKLAVRFMGFDVLAAKGEIFKLDVSDSVDIDRGFEGYISSALALGIMEKSDDKFLPKNEVKFGDMVKTLYKAAQILEADGQMPD
ncbi:MAG TPA: hypothetical protein GXX35_10760 [Thermoanaerobacterales bacterium]|nr:hypothetical protein [Thermoanaerobacterales bacterium]